MNSPIDLILGDPNPLMLQALAEIFDRDRRFSLIASSKTAEGFLEACLRAPVSLGVIDWSLPLLGAERLLAILRDRPKPPRIVIYASSNDPDIPRRAMAAGAAAFARAIRRRNNCSTSWRPLRQGAWCFRSLTCGR